MNFLTKTNILNIHTRTITEHGGTLGIRDESALESALFAPENRFYYEKADVFGCAAAYAFHLSMSHAFVDGNKRVAAIAAEVFLLINGIELTSDEMELQILYLGVADGAIERPEVEEFYRKNSLPLE